LELCCKLADCKGFIGVFKARMFVIFSSELRAIPIKLNLRKKSTEKIDITPISENDAALITFTTGSTGTPKAANRTHGFLKAQFEALLDEIEPKYTDIDMPVLPIVLFVNLGVGCTSVIANFKMTKPESMNATAIATQIYENKVNRITASPFFIRKIAKHLKESKTELSGIEKIFTGGAPVFPDEAKLYREAFPNTITKIVYGSTEAEPISSIDANFLVNRAGELKQGLPVGKPYHKAEIRIIRIIKNAISVKNEDTFQLLCAEDGEIGEIVVSGAHVLKQYYNNEVAFKENKIVVGNMVWHRTGDSGFMKQGELFLTGRCKQLINIETGLISPFIIENQLQSIDGITMGTILYVDNKLILVIETSLSISQIEQHIAEIDYDVIKTIAKIPRDPRHNSKIDYEKLRRLV
ncbi:MAG: AMP-binding protein, partial [Cyclobacteriaceae bacterium]|nr:AMP-binding protein [Cyclobacteriaceae bacterium]